MERKEGIQQIYTQEKAIIAEYASKNGVAACL